jgi:predicted metal-binding transcription factor (methanogenesis marker protein 9)
VELVLVLLVLAASAAVISSPLWRRTVPEDAENADVEALEAAKATKLSEIRDMELDFRIGKLSEDEYHALDRQLREEAVDLLHRLDAAQADGDGAGR